MCDFCRREDDFLKALKERKLHICHYRREGSKTRIDALLKASQEQVTVIPIGEEIALFAAKAISCDEGFTWSFYPTRVSGTFDKWSEDQKSKIHQF
jgi:hypothetical protein